jgi:AraC family transcriptional regulator, ethanolamine operon transcriptional activator
MQPGMKLDVQSANIGRWHLGNYPHPASPQNIHTTTTRSCGTSMKYIERSTDDIDEMFAWEEGWDRRYLQLSKGPLRFRTRQVFLPNLMIEWNSFGQSVWSREVLDSSALFFGCLLDSTGPAVYRGREMLETEALIYHPGVDQEYRVRPQSESLVLAITPPLTEQLGWRLSQESVQRVQADRLDRLVAICQSVTRAALTPDSHPPNADWETALRDRVLVALRAVLAPWTANESQTSNHSLCGARGFQMVKRAEQLMGRWPLDRKLRVAELAAELETSERVLYEAFRTTLGVGPYEFHLLKQMHAFRDSLLSGQTFRGTVTKAAMANGFTHMGRLSQMYRQHFDETPRQTIQRRNSAASM